MRLWPTTHQACVSALPHFVALNSIAIIAFMSRIRSMVRSSRRFYKATEILLLA